MVGLRLFDTYISDDDGFSILHIYVCAAIILKWASALRKQNFSDKFSLKFGQGDIIPGWKLIHPYGENIDTS